MNWRNNQRFLQTDHLVTTAASQQSQLQTNSGDLCLCLPACPSLHTCLSICLPASFCLPTWLPVCLAVSASLALFLCFCLSVCVSVCLSLSSVCLCLFVCLSASVSVNSYYDLFWVYNYFALDCFCCCFLSFFARGLDVKKYCTYSINKIKKSFVRFLSVCLSVCLSVSLL